MTEKIVEKEASDYEKLLLEYHDFVADKWIKLDELRMELVKKMWDASGKPYNDFVRKELEEYGLI